LCANVLQPISHNEKNKLVTQTFKFIYIPTDNAAFNEPVFKKTAVTKYIFVGICYFDFHPSETKNVGK
jgi:hypothetical protein